MSKTNKASQLKYGDPREWNAAFNIEKQEKYLIKLEIKNYKKGQISI